MSVTLNFVRDILDHQLVDRENEACGKVDDVELEFDGKALHFRYLLSGPGAAANRMPRWAASIYRRIAGNRVTRIPWGDVLCISGMIHLRKTARELGLDGQDPPARKVLEASR